MKHHAKHVTPDPGSNYEAMVAWQSKPQDEDLEVKLTTDGRGNGLFALKSFEDPNQWISVYVGEIRNTRHKCQYCVEVHLNARVYKVSHHIIEVV